MEILTVTKENFEQEVLKSSKPVLVDFWAPWCGPCRMIGPILEEIASENDSFIVGKVNVDEQKELAERFSVMTIPTLVVFKDGAAVETAVGSRPKQDILNLMGV